MKDIRTQLVESFPELEGLEVKLVGIEVCRKGIDRITMIRGLLETPLEFEIRGKYDIKEGVATGLRLYLDPAAFALDFKDLALSLDKESKQRALEEQQDNSLKLYWVDGRLSFYI